MYAFGYARLQQFPDYLGGSQYWDFPVNTSHLCSFDEKTGIRNARTPEAQDVLLPQHDQPSDAPAVAFALYIP